MSDPTPTPSLERIVADALQGFIESAQFRDLIKSTANLYAREIMKDEIKRLVDQQADKIRQVVVETLQASDVIDRIANGLRYELIGFLENTQPRIQFEIRKRGEDD